MINQTPTLTDRQARRLSYPIMVEVIDERDVCPTSVAKDEIGKVSLLEFNKAETLIEGGIKATFKALYHIKKAIKQKLK